MKNIEVEIRSFLTADQFAELLAFFNKEGAFNGKDFQETIYFDCEQDFRIQKNTQFAKLWYKGGKLHDDQREEIEIKFAKDDFEACLKLLKSLNFNEDIKWLRTRHTFDWQGIKVMLDHTRGYGHIIELEKMATPETQGQVLTDLHDKLSSLGLKQTDKAEFDQQFSFYKKNWRDLIDQAA